MYLTTSTYLTKIYTIKMLTIKSFSFFYHTAQFGTFHASIYTIIFTHIQTISIVTPYIHKSLHYKLDFGTDCGKDLFEWLDYIILKKH
jgi:hypothetical protein